MRRNEQQQQKRGNLDVVGVLVAFIDLQATDEGVGDGVRGEVRERVEE